MPTYVYQVVLADDEEGQIFEVQQKMTDPPLTEHPITGQPVKRVITPPNIASKYTEKGLNNAMADNKKLEQMGFTKYVKSGDGTYEKHAGKQGPDVISAD